MSETTTECGLDETRFKLHTTQTRSTTASSLIEEQMLIYMRDLVKRQYPHCIDGLKSVQRRILWTVGTNTDLLGLLKIIGGASDLHVSGDSSIYGALVRITQDFQVGHPLIHIQGSSGCYADESAAAARYIKARATDFTKDIFFNGTVRNSLPMMFDKEFKTFEPEYFIPRIPTALLFNHLTIGIAYKSITPQLNLNDICDLVMRQVESRTKSMHYFVPPKIMAKYLIPDYPIDNYILNRNELLQNYTQGIYNCPIRVSGKIDIVDEKFILRSCAFGYSYFGTYEKLCNELKDKTKKHWLLEHVKEFGNYSTNETQFTMAFKNNATIFKFLDRLKKILCVEDAIHPSYRYTQNSKLVKIEPPLLLSLWYDERKKSILSGIKYRQIEYTSSRMEKMARLVIADNTDEVITILRNSKDQLDAVDKLTDKFKQLTRNQAKIIYGTPMGILSSQSKKEILSDLDRIDRTLDEILNTYTRIDETIYNDAQFIKKKYGKQRMTTFIEDQMGYIGIDKKGIIQFNSPEDLYTLLDNNFSPSKDIVLKTYHSYLPNRTAMNGTRPVVFKHTNIPKELACTSIVEYPNNPLTLCRMNESVSIISGFKTTTDEKTQVQYLTKKFYAIRIDGRVIESDAKDFTARKSISKGAKSNIIYTLPGNCKDMIVIHMHPKDPNTLHLDRILHGDTLGKIVTVPTPETVIIDVQPITNSFVAFNIPQNCVNKLGLLYMTITNIGKLFENSSSYQTISLNKLSGKSYSRYIKKHPTLSKLLTLVFPK